jgi:sulfite reductase alpha subunit-like flavoprotein
MTTQSESPLFILYGSATGNAKQIAKDLAAKYTCLLKNPDTDTPYFPSVVCCELDQFKRKGQPVWDQEPTVPGTKYGVLVVTSTTGNADPPENAGRFVRFIKRKQGTGGVDTSQPFKNCAFAVLALGDTNYDQFCHTGKLVDKKMQELGGTRFVKVACADEAVGMEDTVEPWIGSVLAQVTEACRGSKSAGNKENDKTATPEADVTNTGEERKVELVDKTTTTTTTETTTSTVGANSITPPHAPVPNPVSVPVLSLR